MKRSILVVLLHLVFISSFSQNLDIDILRQININRNKSLDGTFSFITRSVIPVTLGTPVLVGGIGLIKKDSLCIRESICMAATVIVVSGVSYAMKRTINRKRPFITYPEIEKLASGGSPSFPSGHTSDAFATATSLSLAFPKWYIITPSFVWASAMGYSRMHLGVHYPSDVLAGALVGAGSAYLCHYANKWIVKKRIKH